MISLHSYPLVARRQNTIFEGQSHSEGFISRYFDDTTIKYRLVAASTRRLQYTTLPYTIMHTPSHQQES
jgi:hypothetical protein